MSFIVNDNKVYMLTHVDLSDWIYDDFLPALEEALSLHTLNGVRQSGRTYCNDKELLEIVLAGVMISVLGSDDHILDWTGIASLSDMLGSVSRFDALVNQVFEAGSPGRLILDTISKDIDKSKQYVLIGTKLYYVKRQ